MKIFFLNVIFIFLFSCKKSVSLCFDFNKVSYTINDTIIANANCSENVVDYQEISKEGLKMIGNGSSSVEKFIVDTLKQF